MPQSRAKLIKSFNQIARDSRLGYDGDAAVAALQQLIKAQGIADAPGIGGTGPLQIENLDPVMTEVLITESDFKIFGALPRVPSKNTTYEWNRKRSYGSYRGTAGFKEGGAPKGTPAKYQRQSAQVRFLGERGGVTHQYTVAGDSGGTAVDPVAEENRNTAVKLFAKTERASLRGREDILDEEGNEVNYDGLIPQMENLNPSNVIDLEGQPMDYDVINEQAYNLRTKGKLVSFSNLRGFCTPFVLTDLAALAQPTERSELTSRGKRPVVPGTPFGGLQSQFGFMPLEDSLFMEEVDGDQPLEEADAKSPAAPASVSGVAAVDVTSKLEAATYYYFVASVNEVGESLTTASTGVAVDMTGGAKKVTVTIQRVAAATHYRIYRGTTNVAADARWIGTVTQTASANPTFVDKNQQRPGTGTAVWFNAVASDICIAQLAPLIKWPFAVVNTTVEFALMLYHTLAVKAPERIIVVKNIGRAGP